MIISEKEFNSIKDVNDQLAYLQLFYKDINISSTANVIAHKIIKDLKPDIINHDNIKYGLVRDNDIISDNMLNNIISDDWFNPDSMNWDNPFDIINLNDCSIVDQPNINNKSDDQSEHTDQVERVVYINDRIVVTCQLIDILNEKDKPSLFKRLRQTSSYMNYNSKTKFYIFKYRIYINPLLNINNDPNNLIKITEVTAADDSDLDLISNFNGKVISRQSRALELEISETLKSVNSIMKLSSFSLDKTINILFRQVYLDGSRVNFFINMITGNELQDEFIFLNETSNGLKPDPNRLLIKETQTPAREDITCIEVDDLIKAGYNHEKIIENPEELRYILIEKKQTQEQFNLLITIYDNIEDLQRNLQIQDKKQLVNLDDYRNIERDKEDQIQNLEDLKNLEDTSGNLNGFGQPVGKIGSLVCIDPFGQYEDSEAFETSKKAAEISDEIGEDMTYKELKQTEIMSNINATTSNLIINNLEVLFDSMDHVDNLGHIKSVYKPLSIIAGNLKNLITPEEHQDLVSKINQYRNYIYINQQELTAADIFSINEEYLRDHEITLKERADLFKQDINKMSLGGSRGANMQAINEKLHTIKVRMIDVTILLAATKSGYKPIDKTKDQQDNQDEFEWTKTGTWRERWIHKKNKDITEDHIRQADMQGNWGGDPFISSNVTFDARLDKLNFPVYTDMLHSVIIDNIAMPRDIFETIKSLSDKYMEFNIRESFGFMNDQFDFD